MIGFETEKNMKDYLIVKTLGDDQTRDILFGIAITKHSPDNLDYALWIKRAFGYGGTVNDLFLPHATSVRTSKLPLINLTNICASFVYPI